MSKKIEVRMLSRNQKLQTSEEHKSNTPLNHQKPKSEVDFSYDFFSSWKEKGVITSFFFCAVEYKVICYAYIDSPK